MTHSLVCFSPFYILSDSAPPSVTTVLKQLLNIHADRHVKCPIQMNAAARVQMFLKLKFIPPPQLYALQSTDVTELLV